MADPNPTADDLVKAKAIIAGEIDAAAVEALLNGRLEAPFRFVSGWSLDLAEAIGSHAAAKEALEGNGGTVGFQRTMARTAILMAPPEKA